MAFTIRGEVAGLNELRGALAGVDRRVRRKALQKGIRAGCSKINKLAKQKVRRRSGLLAKSIGVKVKTYRGDRNGGAVVGVIGPRKGFRKQVGTYKTGPKAGQPVYEDPVNIAHLIEKGHGGPHPARAYPFMRPALDESKSDVASAVSAAVQAELHK